MQFGYNTNGFAFHRFEDTLAILHELGYRAVGITLDHAVLDPFDPEVEARTKRIAEWIHAREMRCVVETGARFLLDPRRKHQPTMVSPSAGERERRLDFLRRAMRIAQILEADALSFWSGSPVDKAGEEEWNRRLLESMDSLVTEAAKAKVYLALEPEPGMFIATTQQGLALVNWIGSPYLGLTVDVGHAFCQDEGEIPDLLRQCGDRLFNVHIEDMRRGVHDHLFFGEGEMDFPPILQTLREMWYAKGVYVELSRHSHDAVETARRAKKFLNRCLSESSSENGASQGLRNPSDS